MASSSDLSQVGLSDDIKFMAVYVTIYDQCYKYELYNKMSYVDTDSQFLTIFYHVTTLA